MVSSRCNYDVFISFRGADVRDGFLSHLVHALSQNQIVTFMDENLERGEQISPALLRVIEESHVALVIFSKNYADSPWCLDELVKIVDCNKTMGQTVVPIFYHVDPTDIQELTGSFGEAFKGLLGEEFKSKTQSWSNALRETAEISGFDSRNLKPESKLIEEIVSLVHEKVNHPFSYSSIDAGLIGIDSRVNDIESKLFIGSKNVWFLGIWGMGGIGKTTIARKIYHRISSQFESAYFVSNVRERLEKYTLDDLQHEILSELLGKELSNSRRPNIVASSFVCKWMRRKKVLIVLDDVSDPEQIEVLIGKHDVYGPGSRVIMTSRDKQILMNGGTDEICKLEELNDREALQLLSLHAFKQNFPPEEYTKLAKKAVSYARGIPLALKVLGSTLYIKNIGEWEDQLEKLEVMVDKRIQNILKMSYDELDYMEQEIFLDIACFFKGEDRDHAESILQGCGFNARIGIGVLLNKALITISGNELNMHDLLQQLGRYIVREKCIEEPWNCSRLWIPQDIYNVLTKDMGEISVKSISLDISKTGDINVSSSAFTRMKKLRLLKFYNPYHQEAQKYSSFNAVIKIQQPKYLLWLRYSRTINFLPDELRYLYWYGYPSKALPLSFCPKNLVQLHLIRSHVEQLCIKKQCFESLKLMDLSYSVKLIRIPDLSRFPKLEVLNLRGCTSLVEIRSTRLYYSELRHLNLESCRSLWYVSRFLHMEHLDFLSLEDCSKITEFPVIPRSIKFLILSKTAVKKVPPSIEHCSQLTKLEMNSCTSLQSLPSNIGELQVLELLNLKGCLKLTSLPDSTCSLKSLKSLFINECKNLKELPENIGNLKSLEKFDATKSGIRILPPTINGLVKLETLDCNGCKDLILPPFTGLPSLKRLSLDDCGLSEISDSFGSLKSLFVLYLDGNNLKKLPLTIKELSKLTRLHLRSNKRLQYIPELPSSLYGLSVHNCTSLEKIPPFTCVNKDIFQFLDARNCINLDKNCGTKIMDAVLLGIEDKLQKLRHFRKYNRRLCKEMLLYRVCLAGDELPGKMKHKNEKGSTIFISMEQYDQLDSMVIVFSTVVASSTNNKAKAATKFDKSVIKCECCFVTESGSFLTEHCYHDLFRPDKYSEEYVLSLENNWVWAYKFEFKDKQRFTEASFQFFVKTRKFADVENGDLRVIKCGVLCLPY